MNGLQYHRNGRTSRRRTKRTLSTKLNNVSCDPSVIVLVQWMCSQGWQAASKLRLASSFVTGRGLQAVNGVKSGEILVRIPEKLLITSDNVRSRLKLENLPVSLTEHCLLTLFIVLEMHSGSDSPWFPYFQTLPQTFSVPCYCSDSEISYLPSFMRNRVLDQKKSVEVAFMNGCEFIETLISNEKICSSSPIPTFLEFMFAWFVVNTRAVYMSSRTDTVGCEPLKSSNGSNLALAPYLDMFNHSFNARVEAGFNHSTRSYEIRSLVQFPPKSQVFINYGPHDNMKLWIEYGFCLSNNPHDVVMFTFDDILASAKKNSQTLIVTLPKMEFVRGHGLLENLSCSLEGLSWSLSALICIISLEDFDKSSYYRVFRGDWTPFESLKEREFALDLIACKKLELIGAQNKMEELKNCSNSFKIAHGVLDEYVNILCRAEAKYKYLFHKSGVSSFLM